MHTSGGKLPMTWYPQAYVAKVSMTNMDMRADPTRGYPGRTYRFYKGPTVFPFGAGFSYTRFNQHLVSAPTTISVPTLHSNLEGNNATTMKKNAVRTKHIKCESLDLNMHIDVKNIGDMDGTHTILIFSIPSYTRMKQLITFEKVYVVAGAQQRVKINMNICKHFSIADEYGIRRIFMGEHKIHVGEDLRHSITFQAP
ncbi:beta-D-xylosidase [Datura stramonium]|uniref:Beta-D-xylosidase n=1 Tax=Datura stramonium TaxID=4076 RepID=A0ABS8V6M9_DATST|nr:beta-D-xylosidase [Datura stramonium]